MGYGGNITQMNAYNQIVAHAGVMDASPHRIIQMLMAGAIDKIAIAKGHMERKDFPKSGSHISWAISIIDGLRVSLDKEVGGPMVENLDALYDYMNRRLLEANVKNDSSLLDEVTKLIREVKAGWDGIEEEVTKLAAQQGNKDD